MLTGQISSGCGKASKISENKFQARCKAAGATLTRGTLNVRVDDLKNAVSFLGTPDFETDIDDKRLGPLRWWKVKLFATKFKLPENETFVVRHYKTKTNYLELMSTINFSKYGLNKDNVVHIQLNRIS